MTVISKAAYFNRIGYAPHDGQKDFHNNKARFKIAVCGRRYGKSTMAAREVSPRLFLPDMTGWIIGPTYDLGEKEFRIIWNDIMRGLELGNDSRIKRGYNKKTGTMYIQTPWNHRLEVRTADHPENLVGEALDYVIMSEAAKHKRETWEQYVRPALADKHGDAIFCTTPEGQNWLYDLYMLGQDPSHPDYASWRFPSWENSAVFPGGRNDPEIKLLEATLSPEYFAQEIAAEFTSFVGRIYSEFDERTHVKPLVYNPNLPNYLFVDFGYVNPLAALDVQILPNDTVHIWREWYKPWLRLEDHIQAWKQREDPEGYKIETAYADSEDPEAIATMNVRGIPTFALPEAKVNWRQGIEVVKRSLRMRDTGNVDDFGDPILRPMLYVDPSCTHTIREFLNYKMAEPPRTGTDPQEKPKKKEDHAMDAIRYGLMHYFELGAKYHLSDIYSVSSVFGSEPTSSALSVGREVGHFTRSKEF